MEIKDNYNVKNTKRPLVGLIISLISGVIFVAAVTIASILYNQMKLTVSFTDSLKAMGMLAIIIAFLLFVGMISIVGYLLMTIKTGKKKLIPTIILIIPVAISLVIGVIGITFTKAQYDDYKTFTREKWSSASDNHDYRGLLIYSFLDQYDIVGYSEIQVKELLGNYDWVTETNIWVYDLGYYKDYMDPTTFEITFSELNTVVSYDVVSH